MLKIHSKVNSPYGEGILVSMVTEYNGLHIIYERTKCVVWFGSDNPGKSDKGHGNWISHEFTLNELVKLNQDVLRNDKLSELGL
jgi:hypothetical protein